jgi:hypothetical protein
MKRNEYPADLSLAEIKRYDEPRLMSGIGELRPEDEAAVARSPFVRAQQRQQRTKEAAAAIRSNPAAGLYNPYADVAAQRSYDPTEDVAQTALTEQNQTDRALEWREHNQPKIDRQTHAYKREIQAARRLGGDPAQWLKEFQTKAGAQLLEPLGAVSNNMRVRVEAAQQAAAEEGADRNAVSKFAQDLGAGLIGSAPELVAMSAGVPPPVAFGAGGGIRAKARGEDPNVGMIHGVGTGLAFEVPGVGQGLTRAITKAGAVGATSAGLELAAGRSPKEAVTSGATNALMVGVPAVLGARGATRERPIETQPNVNKNIATEQPTAQPLDRSVEGTDAAPRVESTTMEPAHHSAQQLRRTRNTESGTRGQFKRGKLEQLPGSLLAKTKAAEINTESETTPALLYHGSDRAHDTVQPGSMLTSQPEWAAGYTTKVNPANLSEQFTGKVHEIPFTSGNSLEANTLHDAEQLLITKAQSILGREPVTLREAAEAVHKGTGADAIVVKRNGVVADAISLIERTVSGKLEPQDAIVRAQARGVRVPENLLRASREQPAESTPAVAAEPSEPSTSLPQQGQRSARENINTIPDGSAILARKATQAERKGGIAKRRGYDSVMAKDGYEVVYKPYGNSGDKADAGYYYVLAKGEPAEVVPIKTFSPREQNDLTWAKGVIAAADPGNSIAESRRAQAERILSSSTETSRQAERDATVSLLENEGSGVLYDKIVSGKVTPTEVSEFKASELGISPEHTDKLIASAREGGIQEIALPSIKPTAEAPIRGQRSLPKTLEAAQMEKGENLSYTPEKIAEGADVGRENVKTKGVDGAIERVLRGDPDIDWAPTGFAALNEMRDRANELRGTNSTAADALDTKRRQFAGDFAERATKLGQAIVGIKAIEEFAPDRAAYIAAKMSKKARGRGLSAEEDTRVTKTAEELERVSKKYESLQQEFAKSQSEAIKRAEKKGGKPEKKDYQSNLERRSEQAKQTLIVKLGKLDFGALKVSKGERGAVKVSIPELPGDAELLSQYAAGRLGKVNTVAELNAELVKEFGAEVEPHLKDIRERAYAIRQEARLAEIASAETPKPRRRTILHEIEKEIGQARNEARDASRERKVDARESDRQTQRDLSIKARDVGVAEKAQAQAETTIAKRGEGEGRAAEVREARQRLKQVQQEYKDARKAELKGWRETIRAQKQATRTTSLWDTPIRNMAQSARERVANGSTDINDLAVVGAEKFLPTTVGGPGRLGSISPAQFYTEMKAEFPELVTNKNQGEVYKRAYQQAKDAASAAQEAARQRSASVESQRVWDELGVDENAQAIMIQRATARRRQLELRRQMAQEFSRVSRSRASKIFHEAISIPRALQSSIDAPLGRQGLFYSVTHPIETIRYTVPATLEGYKSFRRADYQRATENLQQHPDYVLARESGVDLPELAGNTDPRTMVEEGFQSPLAEKLPHVRLSEQGFTLGMNTQRVNAFSRYASIARMEGYTPESHPEFFKQAAQLVNDATGRGHMPEAIKRMSTISNALFYSTRLNISRVQLLNDLFNPVHYIPEARNPLRNVKGFKSYDPVMRRIAIGETIRLAAGMAAIYGSAKMLGLGVTMNPYDPDFGKVRWGKATYDVTGGNAGTLRFLFRFLRGIERHLAGDSLSRKDEPLHLISPFEQGSFIRQKLSPLAGSGVNLYQGKDVIGEPTSWKKEAWRLIAPMVVGDYIDAVSEDGWVGAAKTTPALTGISTQYYDPNKPRPKPVNKVKAIKPTVPKAIKPTVPAVSTTP